MSDSIEALLNGTIVPLLDPNFFSNSGYNAVHELMRAMILRTIEDFNSGAELRDEAIAYMSEVDDDYVLSFSAICRHFGLDPTRTRGAIMNTTRRISTRRRTV